MKIILVLAALLSVPAFADYQQCVVGSLQGLRKTSLCNFDFLQSQLLQANRDCLPEIMKLLKPEGGVDGLRSLSAQIPAIKDSADRASEQLLQAELDQCHLGGSIKISKGGTNLQITVIQIR